MKRWTIVALANEPYLPHIKRLAESLRKSGTTARTCFTLVNCDAELPVDEVIHRKYNQDQYYSSETHYCIWGKPRLLREIMRRGDSDYVVWIDADSIVLKNLDFALEKMERAEMCSKQKVSNGKMLTGMISMSCTKKMKKLCNEWEKETYAFSKTVSKPWSSSQRTMNKIIWPSWKNRVKLWRIPGWIFDVKWRKGSYVWTACGVDDRIASEKAWENIK